MKAISIRQPWAWCIANGHKQIENRDWRTKYRGEVLIHASKKIDKQGLEWIKQSGLVPDLPETFETGGIVGKATIVDCVSEIDGLSESDSHWFIGRFGFLLEDASAMPLVPLRGKLGLFNVKCSKTIHVGLNIAGALQNTKLKGWLCDENGQELTDAEVRAALIEDLRKGHDIFVGCNLRRPDGGCAGHLVLDEDCAL